MILRDLKPRFQSHDIIQRQIIRLENPNYTYWSLQLGVVLKWFYGPPLQRRVVLQWFHSLRQ